MTSHTDVNVFRSAKYILNSHLLYILQICMGVGVGKEITNTQGCKKDYTFISPAIPSQVLHESVCRLLAIMCRHCCCFIDVQS